MERRRLAIYVTLLADSEMVEYFAVHDIDGERSDLWNDGLCRLSRLPSALAELCAEWVQEQTAEASRSSSPSSSTV